MKYFCPPWDPVKTNFLKLCWNFLHLIIKVHISKNAEDCHTVETVVNTQQNKYWKSVQLILPNSCSKGIEVIYDPGKDEVVGGIKAADVINEYFANIGENLAEKLPNATNSFWPKPVEVEFTWDCPIVPSDIEHYSKEFCPSKSSGIVGLSSRLLLDFFTLRPDVMATIFNKCLQIGIYPSLWKHSIMVPIPKNKNPYI